MKSPELKIEYLPVGDLKPYEKNARKHEDADVQTIVASIKEFGFDDPIGVWGDDNLIVEGHGRLLAAKKLGMKTVPVIHLDHLTDEQRRAYALAHNKTAEMSEWDFDILGGELDDIFDIDMEQFGFFDGIELPPIPDNLDIDTDYGKEPPLTIKLTFPNFAAYSIYEGELKDIAERMGCIFSVMKV